MPAREVFVSAWNSWTQNCLKIQVLTHSFHALNLFISCNAFKDFWGQKKNVFRDLVVNLAEMSKDFLFLCPFSLKSLKRSWFRAFLLLLNEHFVRSLRATRAREHCKLCAHLLSGYEYLVNLSISVVVLHLYSLNKCITISPRCPSRP